MKMVVLRDSKALMTQCGDNTCGCQGLNDVDVL